MKTPERAVQLLIRLPSLTSGIVWIAMLFRPPTSSNRASSFSMGSTIRRMDLGTKFKPIGSKDKEIILQKFNSVFDELDFATPQKKQTQKLFWKKLLGKAFLTKREAFIIMGFLKKLLRKL